LIIIFVYVNVLKYTNIGFILNTQLSPIITFDNEKGFLTSQYPGIEFILEKTIDKLDLSDTFKLLYEIIPELKVEHLPQNIFEKSLIKFPAQAFQFEDYIVLNNLRSLEVDVRLVYSRLRSIHCEIQHFEQDCYQLIYLFDVNSAVNVQYQLAKDDLTWEDVSDQTSANLIALFYTYNSRSKNIVFDNAELVLFEDNVEAKFEGKLLFYPDKLIY
jgi:hypothetical protein